MSEPHLNIVEVVTPKHGEKFAEDWHQTDSMEEACDLSEIVEWPEWDHAGQLRSLDIQEEIVDRVFKELRSVMADTFVRVANDVEIARIRDGGGHIRNVVDHVGRTSATGARPQHYGGHVVAVYDQPLVLDLPHDRVRPSGELR